MNRDEMEGKWKQIKGNFKEKWGKFTDDDIQRMNGNREKIVGALQEKYGRTKEQAQKDFDEWYAGVNTPSHETHASSGRR